MVLDEMLETPEAVIEAEKAQQVTSATLKSLGYEVVKPTDSKQGVDFNIKKGTVQYSLAVAFAGPQSETHFRIPVGSIDAKIDNIFTMEAQCIAFYQEKYEGGTIFTCNIQDLRNITLQLVKKLKENKAFSFYAHNALEKKRLHASYREDVKGYVIYVYLPIEAVCKNIKMNKQRVGK